VLSVHFELIAPLPHYAMPTLGPYTKGQIRKEPLHKLESFAIQEELSSELIYLSETSVGLSRLIAEDYDGAISHLTGALNAKGSRSSAEVRANRGIAYLSKASELGPESRKATLKQAEADFTKVINQQPSLHKSSYFNRGQVYLLLGEYDRAVSDLTNSMNQKPDDADYRTRAQAYAEIPDYPKAIADASHAIRLRPTAENYEQRGVIYLSKRDIQHAWIDFNNAIKLKPNANTYMYRSTIFDSMGKRANGLEDLNKAVELDPTEAAWYYDRGLHQY
jgi:tetratricopeptide (TPR) repeat protein